MNVRPARRQREVAHRKMGGATLRVHQRAARARIACAIGAPQLVEHQLAAIGQLQRQPVPALLLALQEAGAELVIHPAVARHFKPLAVHGDGAARGHARERVVVGRVAGLRPLLTDAVQSVDDRTLAFGQHQLHAGLPALRGDHMAALRVEPGGPVLVPHLVGVGGRARQPRPAARELLVEAVAVTGRVAHRQVRHEQVANRPCGGVDRRRIHADAEERHLVAEAAPGGGLHVAGVVPPLDLELGMAGVIARELEAIACRRLAPCRRRGRHGDGAARGPLPSARRLASYSS